MERKFDIGDIVYLKSDGYTHYEVSWVYPIETEERYFRLKPIMNFDIHDFNPTRERFFSTENFRHLPYVLKRKILFEKCLKI